ncbi:hypothetical protein GCM10011506_45020 [Marivirga lumbricoides]|uniref:Uncharacterized protein n=1 Tax=Marivirga lumbricoides TaxID=1046115 RepID=A0ABQ1N5K5_9BACT|nr:hypothetical protein GCM10011506_45020 [Marivirga lumbricoides]
MKDKTNAVNKDGMSKGRLIFRNIFFEGIPATDAASSKETGICLIPLPIILDAIKPNFPRYAINRMSEVP